MANNREIKVATITITVLRRKKFSLLPGWEYGTRIDVSSARDDITPKDRAVVEQMYNQIRKTV